MMIEKAQEFYAEQDKYAKTNSLELFNLCLVIYTRNYLSPSVEVDIKEFTGSWLMLDLLKGNKEFTLLKEVTKTDDKIKLYYADNELTKQIRKEYIETKQTPSPCGDGNDKFIKLEELLKNHRREIRKLANETERLEKLVDTKNKQIKKLEEERFEKNAFEKAFKQLREENSGLQKTIKEVKDENERLEFKNLTLQELVEEFREKFKELKNKEISICDVVDNFGLDFYSGSLFKELLELDTEEVKKLYRNIKGIK